MNFYKIAFKRQLITGINENESLWKKHRKGYKLPVTTTKAAAVKGVTKAKELVSIPNLLPYNLKNQLLLAGGSTG